MMTKAALPFLMIIMLRDIYFTTKSLFKLEVGKMKLGAFSLSLNVADIHNSKEFYENLGFKTLGGDISQNWLILKNDQCIIGLFQGMFEKNALTFNPGWDENAENVASFTDVRGLQKQLKEKGVKLLTEVDESTEDPGYFTLEDPDGNPILVDQHR